METDESTAQLQPKISAMYFSKLKEGIKIDKYEQSLRKKKLSKFTRDTLDYKHVNVYSWLKIFRPFANKSAQVIHLLWNPVSPVYPPTL